MLKKLRLTKFRSFRDFTVTFGNGAYLVGPNNAGKSTILTSLRTADVLLRFAYRRKPTQSRLDNGISRVTYPANLREFPALRDSLRFEFGGDEARLELEWKSNARLTAVWPAESEDDDDSGFFYLTQPSGLAVRNPAQAKSTFPELGVIPILGPTEHSERLLDINYVKQNISGRLSSRHFRNQLRILQSSGELEDFLVWADQWLGELSFDTLNQVMSDEGAVIQAFFYENGSRVPKEIVWAGDGVQVWLQLLYHIYRVRDRDTIILDEPEVYLHPDLQRRLVQLLESTGRQTIVATHSAEMLAESDGRLTTLIDRGRRHSSRPKSDADFELLSSTLGTAFNLRLAKALRSKVAVFVEGQDMSVLRIFAKTLGLSAIEREIGITVIPLQGYSNWGHVEPFKLLCDELLPNAIRTFVILDRDYRPDDVRTSVLDSFRVAGIRGHVWERKELESYLLNVQVLSKCSKSSASQINEWLETITMSMEDDVFSRLLDERIRAHKSGTRHGVTVTAEFKQTFDREWGSLDFRLSVCPPKQIISKLNGLLQDHGYSSLSMAALARAHNRRDIPQEVKDLLVLIDNSASNSTENFLEE